MILNTFKTLLGNGRAWHLIADNINDVTQAFLKPVNDLRVIFYRIAFAPFPTANIYNTQEGILSDLENFESQFGINRPSKIIVERGLNIEAQWGMVGGQGYGYIENALKSAGLPVKVIENLPAADLSVNNVIQYGNYQYGEDIEGDAVQYGQSGYRLIGNGLLNIAGEIYDPVELTNFKDVFFVEGLQKLTFSQYDMLVDTILKIKPLNTVCLAKVQLN